MFEWDFYYIFTAFLNDVIIENDGSRDDMAYSTNIFILAHSRSILTNQYWGFISIFDGFFHIFDCQVRSIVPNWEPAWSFKDYFTSVVVAVWTGKQII